MRGWLSRRNSFDPSKDLLDLTGKVIVVTGGNSGIGYQTVKHLARRGAKVYLGARDESKATGALAKLLHEGLGPGNGEIAWFKVDFSELQGAKEAAETFLRLEERLDVLINNAGQLTGPFEKTKDGISRHMTVNHFGPYIFTRALLPLLVKTSKEPDSDVRIVTLSSGSHRASSAARSGIRFRAVADFNEDFSDAGWPDYPRYCMSKLANMLWMRQLQKHVDEMGVAITCMPISPGRVNTFASRTPYPLISTILFPFISDVPEVGAYTSCFAAASPAVQADPQKYKGAFLEPVGIITEPSDNAKNDDLAKELWDTTESILKNLGV